MQPRLSSSRKWTAFPKELETQVQALFAQSFKKQIGPGTILVEGRIYPEEILLSVGLATPGSLKQSNFEVSIQYKTPKDNVLKLMHLAVDSAASLFEQFFEAQDDVEFPRLWEEVEIEKRKVFVQYTTTNTALEQQANSLLGDFDPDADPLAKGDWQDDSLASPEHIKASLGIDLDEEADDLSLEEDEDATSKKH